MLANLRAAVRGHFTVQVAPRLAPRGCLGCTSLVLQSLLERGVPAVQRLVPKRHPAQIGEEAGLQDVRPVDTGRVRFGAEVEVEDDGG